MTQEWLDAAALAAGILFTLRHTALFAYTWWTEVHIGREAPGYDGGACPGYGIGERRECKKAGYTPHDPAPLAPHQ